LLLIAKTMQTMTTMPMTNKSKVDAIAMTRVSLLEKKLLAPMAEV
jgi:hypothetical protein